LVTRELGHQSEIELHTKLQNEVEAGRLTRLDKMLLSEQQEQGVIDLRPGEGATFLVRENRNLMIGRVRHLERYGVATELEPGRWTLSDRAEQVLRIWTTAMRSSTPSIGHSPRTASPRSAALANSPSRRRLG